MLCRVATPAGEQLHRAETPASCSPPAPQQGHPLDPALDMPLARGVLDLRPEPRCPHAHGLHQRSGIPMGKCAPGRSPARRSGAAGRTAPAVVAPPLSWWATSSGYCLPVGALIRKLCFVAQCRWEAGLIKVFAWHDCRLVLFLCLYTVTVWEERTWWPRDHEARPASPEGPSDPGAGEAGLGALPALRRVSRGCCWGNAGRPPRHRHGRAALGDGHGGARAGRGGVARAARCLSLHLYAWAVHGRWLPTARDHAHHPSQGACPVRSRRHPPNFTRDTVCSMARHG